MTVMVDSGGILNNPLCGHEAFGNWRNSAYGWNPLLSAKITVSGSSITSFSSFNNNVHDAIVPYFDSSTMECTGVLKITSATGASTITYTKLYGVNPVSTNYLLSPEYEFTMVRTLITLNDLYSTEGVADWTTTEKINCCKVVRELNSIIDDGWITGKKKQICILPALDYPVSGTNVGTAQTASSTSITLESAASGTNDYYNNFTIIITSGTGSQQWRTVSDYNGTSKVATISSAWTVTPDSSSTYVC